MKFFKKFLLVGLIALGVGLTIWGIKDKTKAPLKISPEQPLKFAVMSDIHLDTESLESALANTKNNQIDFIIITGDLTSLGKKDELLKVKKVLDDSGLKYYAVPGNHDLWTSQKLKVNLFREVFGKDFQSFKEDEVKFILVNNGGAGGVDGATGESGERQGDWLKKEIEECPQITCLVFMHMPLNHPNSLHILGEGNEKVTEEAKAWVRLFVQDRVREVFAGHLHFSSSYELDGLKTTVVGAISRERNLQSPKFLEVWREGKKQEEKEVFVAE